MAKKDFMYVDIMADTIGLEFDGINFSGRFSREAMQNRMFGVMHSKDNNWAEGMYAAFLQQKSANPNLTAHDFLTTISESSKKRGKSFDEMLSGIVDLETMGNVFDTFAETQNSSIIASFLCSARTKKVAEDADMAYFYMDQVSEMISKDEGLRANYASMDNAGRQTMIMACFKALKAKGAFKNPTPKKLKAAQARWRQIYRKSSDEAVLISMREKGMDITDSESFMHKFAASMAEVIKKDDTRLLADRKTLRDLEEPMVDVERTPDRFTSDNGMEDEEPIRKERDDNLIEFGKLYPREIPPFKIEKMLQPFNVKAGLKFLDAIIEAFDNVLVKTPWSSDPDSEVVKTRKPNCPTMHR